MQNLKQIKPQRLEANVSKTYTGKNKLFINNYGLVVEDKPVQIKSISKY